MGAKNLREEGIFPQLGFVFLLRLSHMGWDSGGGMPSGKCLTEAFPDILPAGAAGAIAWSLAHQVRKGPVPDRAVLRFELA